MILIGIGSNLAAPPAATPLDTAAAAVDALSADETEVVTLSSWYLSEPVPVSQQPWYVNAVAAIATALPPPALLARLLAVERRFGRRRGARNAARTLDLDLLDYDGRLCESAALTLPHPRLHERRFVLAPLAEIAPRWRHPRLGLSARRLLTRLPRGQEVRRLDARRTSAAAPCNRK
ncbi:MAG TPA: 2-amino-4-hydroxy-6-hydroxymethyldihydropteridine diphosphokinase [Stellaceae bacterium]|nr:2-amino-4-hydroxy-6-hydroxymethyldihydropteridine diphosphokinase [Stellaceae bacterium]